MTDPNTHTPHTKLPWIVNPFRAQIDCRVPDEHGEPLPICQLLWPTDYRSEAETEANAAFIVRAVNSHYELLEALKDILQHADVRRAEEAFIALDLITEAARAAIARAENA